MKHALRIKVSKDKINGGLVTCRQLTVRERLLRFLLAHLGGGTDGASGVQKRNAFLEAFQDSFPGAQGKGGLRYGQGPFHRRQGIHVQFGLHDVAFPRAPRRGSLNLRMSRFSYQNNGDSRLTA